MKILLLSDISWRRTDLGSLTRLVLDLDPSLLLLAGDLVDNDKSEHGNAEAWADLYAFADFLNSNKVRTFFIRGNWDREPYDELVARTRRLPYLEDISARIVEFGGVRIFGVPHSLTGKLGASKRISERFPEPVDIVLAHAELARRIGCLG